MLYCVVWVLLDLGKGDSTYNLEMLIHKDSRTVVMEVEIRLEVCNNLPAE